MKNEYRGLLAVVLSIGVLIFWYTVVAPPQPPSTAPQPITQLQQQSSQQPVQQQLPVAQKIAERPHGLATFLENDRIKIDVDTLGGVLENWELKSFTKNGKDSTKWVNLVDEVGSALEFLPRNANIAIPSPIPFKVANQNPLALDLKWESKQLRIFKRFRLDPDSYLMRLEVEINNVSSETLSFLPTIAWTKVAHEESPQRGVLIFKSPPDKWQSVYYKDDSLNVVMSEKIADFSAQSGKVGWIGAESRYFLGSVIPISKFGDGLEESKQILPGGEVLFSSRLLLPVVQVLPSEAWLQSFNVYGGPKELKSLTAVGPGMDKAIGYGWTNVIAVPILYLLKFFYQIFHNYGVAIILLTVLVKVLLNPINKKSLKSMKAMQELQPKIKELQKKYGEDKQQLNVQMMQLFKTHKVNPMGGCLPMALQFPIYIALYKVLWSSVELYHAPFFWFYKDLSAPDPFLITPILLGVTMVIQTKMTPSPNMDPAQQKMMMIMPLMFCGIMVFLPMGLGLYIFVNTATTILQQKMYNKGIRWRDLLRGRWLPTS